ncbi:Protein NLP3 [Acorus calamus]|uniref:Protein NLP3 n=1 Tax=Acorus calamus TaxID=4465 RepID=A0AAV9DL52_ACOCL|nr:Protein NLP3 [Acorus calamus]
MDLDLEFDESWPFDPTTFISSPPCPYLLSSPPPPSLLHLSSSSTAEQPNSPLWLFSDQGRASTTAAAHEIPNSIGDCPRFFLCNSEPINRNSSIDEGKKQPPPLVTSSEEASDLSYVIKERMTQALRLFKESTEQHVLVQVWAPVKNGDHYVLTTSGQPFILDPHSTGLLQYRTVSLTYVFSVDGGSDGDLGLPGRVFRQKSPEWTPNVQYYSRKEYPRLSHALNYDVRGTLALPVFEPSGQSCVGVVEVIMTSQKINYAPEVDKVCKALEAVNLKSSEILDHPNVQICNEGRQAALAEILEILTTVCETHKFPLAQTWVPCKHRNILAYGGGSKKSCSSFDGSCMGQVCMSTTDVAFYVVDSHMWRFRDACAEHHLQKGQGVAGRAFATHRMCFCKDITQFSKTEYPLVHYARMFGLTGCLAIYLRSTHTGSDEYVLEFFLPPECRDTAEQQALLDALLITVKQCFRSLKVVDEKDLHEGSSVEITDTITHMKMDLELEYVDCQGQESSLHPSHEAKSYELQNGGDAFQDMLEHVPEEIDKEKNANKIDMAGNGSVISLYDKKNVKTGERRRGKAEKSISLEVLRQYFAGSLKDAAKSLGVCPTTMKRICRQHGIPRWPSRKINKVNRSLTKLKRVIESVQGAERAFNLTSVAADPLQVAVAPFSWTTNANGSKPNSTIVKLSDPHEGREREFSVHKSPDTNHPVDMGETTLRGGSLSANVEPVLQEIGSHLELGKDSPKGGSGEESNGCPTSRSSCQGSPVNEDQLSNPSISSAKEKVVNTTHLMGLEFPPIREPNVLDPLMTIEPQMLLSGMLIEDSGSCKDFRDLCNSTMEGFQDENVNLEAIEAAQATQQTALAKQEVRTITIKATYKEDIIRFRLPCTCGMVELNEEVAKRLKLELGTFDIKYLDDDHEWVLLACDADLQECVEILGSSGGNMIRLAVHDIMANLGSSCESSGE